MEWGVHLLRPVSDAEVAFLKRGGINRVTVSLPWRWCEKRPGRFDLTALEHFLSPLRSAGLPLQGVLGPAMPHLMPAWLEEAGGADAPNFCEAFVAHSVQLAERLTDISVFRVEEELNGAFLWDGLRTRKRRGRAWRSAGFRERLLNDAVGAVRAVRPDAQLRATVHAGLPGWTRAIRRWFGEGLAVNCLGLAIQPCRLLPDPSLGARVGELIRDANKALQAVGRSDVAVEVARVGYGTLRSAWSPRRQREFLEAASRSAVDAGAVGFHWWALRDQAHDDPMLGYWTPSQERAMGLLHYDSTPKPAADEFRVIATGDRFGVGGR